MSGYSPKRAPNVSQYVANLNTIPSAHDLGGQQHKQLAFDDDLAIFTNAEFFDFDLGETIEPVPVEYNPAQEERARRENAAGKPMHGLDYPDESYQFSDLPFVPTDPTATLSPHPHAIQTSYPLPPQPPYGLSAFTSPIATQAGSKRPYPSESLSPTVGSPSGSLEASSRAAADEDKRRRNTAASARFRVKKKQREQALEKTAKEMTDRADALEAKIATLELENRWLKNLLVEKTSKGKDDVAELWKKFTAENASNRSKDGRKKGVGTARDSESAQADDEE